MARRKIRKRTYGSGSVFKRSGSVTWTIRWRDKTRDIFTKTGFETRELAEIALAQALDTPNDSRNMPTLSVLVEKWMESRKVTHDNHYNDKLRWHKHLEPTVGAMFPDQVTVEVVKNIIDSKFLEGLKPGTVGLIVKLLSTIYSDLIEGPYASVNPVTKLPKKTKRLLKSDHDPESVPFLRTLDDVKAVFEKLPVEIGAAFAVGAYSGLRSGEIYGLEWSNVDLVNRKIRVCQQVTAGVLKLYPKDGDSRTTIIPNALVPILENWKAVSGGVGRVFAYVGSAKLNEVLGDALTSLQLNEMTWYQATRHTFASQWVLRGGSLEVLQKLMGHSSILVTQRYAHLKLDEFSQADLKRMDIAA